MTRLILIRHGETDYNIRAIYCGASNPPLNSKGIAQAEKLHTRLKKFKIHKIYSSSLKRALQSAKIIFKNRKIQILPEFREVSFGIFEGLTYSEIIKRYESIYQRWIDDTIKTRIPKGENLQDLQKRVMNKLTFLISKHAGKTIAIVTHGGPIRVIICNILKVGIQKFWEMEQANASLNIIQFRGKDSAQILVHNDISHLGGEYDEKGYLYFGPSQER